MTFFIAYFLRNGLFSAFLGIFLDFSFFCFFVILNDKLQQNGQTLNIFRIAVSIILPYRLPHKKHLFSSCALWNNRLCFLVDWQIVEVVIFERGTPSICLRFLDRPNQSPFLQYQFLTYLLFSYSILIFPYHHQISGNFLCCSLGCLLACPFFSFLLYITPLSMVRCA